VHGHVYNPAVSSAQTKASRGSDASRQSVTHALARLPGALFAHVAAEAFAMLDAGEVVLIAPVDKRS
jgi:hypothetical protein